MLEVAIANEFGNERVPERSFIRAWVDENAENINKSLAVIALAGIDGRMTREQAMHQLGMKWVGEMQKRMAKGIDPPNRQSTIKSKGSSTPLIDSGQLRSSITFVYRPT